MSNLSIAEQILCIVITVAFLVGSYFLKKYTKRKLVEQGQLENYQKRKWVSTVMTGAMFLGVALFSLPNMPAGNEPILIFMLALSFGFIGYGLYQRRKAGK